MRELQFTSRANASTRQATRNKNALWSCLHSYKNIMRLKLDAGKRFPNAISSLIGGNMAAILVGQLIISASLHNNLALARASRSFFWYFSNADSAWNSFEMAWWPAAKRSDWIIPFWGLQIWNTSQKHTQIFPARIKFNCQQGWIITNFIIEYKFKEA